VINYALNFVSTPFVLIVDADTYLSSSFVHNVMCGFYSKDVVVSICGLVLPSHYSALHRKADWRNTFTDKEFISLYKQGLTGSGF
jgi:cellulose synthase/poly-beta-1,6-N-acetylglucosamine synthase-like glycosyltransferase